MQLTFRLESFTKTRSLGEITINVDTKESTLHELCLNYNKYICVFKTHDSYQYNASIFSGLEKLLNNESLSNFSVDKLDKIYLLGVSLNFHYCDTFEKSLKYIFLHPMNDVLKMTIIENPNIFATMMKYLHPEQIEYFAFELKQVNHKCSEYFSKNVDVARTMALSIKSHQCRTFDMVKKCLDILEEINKFRFIIYIAITQYYKKEDIIHDEQYFGIKTSPVIEEFVTLLDYVTILCEKITPIMLINQKPLTVNHIINNDIGNDFLTDLNDKGNVDPVSGIIKQWLIYYACYHKSPIIYQVILVKYPLHIYSHLVENYIIDIEIPTVEKIETLVKLKAFSPTNVHLIDHIKSDSLIEYMKKNELISNRNYDYYYFCNHKSSIINDDTERLNLEPTSSHPAKREIAQLNYIDLYYMVTKNNSEYIEFQISRLPSVGMSVAYKIIKELRKSNILLPEGNFLTNGKKPFLLENLKISHTLIQKNSIKLIHYVNKLIKQNKIPSILSRITEINFVQFNIDIDEIITFSEFYQLLEAALLYFDYELVEKIAVIVKIDHFSMEEQIDIYKLFWDHSEKQVMKAVSLFVKFNILEPIFEMRTKNKYSPKCDHLCLIYELSYISYSEDFEYLRRFPKHDSPFNLIYYCSMYYNGDDIVNELLNCDKFFPELLGFYFFNRYYEFPYDIEDELKIIVKYNLVAYLLYFIPNDSISDEFLIKMVHHYPEQKYLIENLIKLPNADEIIHKLWLKDQCASRFYHIFLKGINTIIDFDLLKHEIYFAITNNLMDYFIWLFTNNISSYISLPYVIIEYNKCMDTWIIKEIIKMFDKYFKNITTIHEYEKCDNKFGVLFWDSCFDSSVVKILT